MAAVQQESTATGADAGGLAGTRGDGDLRVWTRVDVLPPDGMQEVSGSSPLSSTQSDTKFERRTDERFPLRGILRGKIRWKLAV
jgi:hypothetical protein